MSEQNITTIVDSIEEVYHNHCRHDVTLTLTNLIIDGISSHSTLLDLYIVLHMAFISSLYKLIGTVFAYFVQNAVASYEQHLASVDEKSTANSTEVPEDLGKECSNLVVLSQSYLSEFRVELLLKLLRNDPMALKDIVTLAQSWVAGHANAIRHPPHRSQEVRQSPSLAGTFSSNMHGRYCLMANEQVACTGKSVNPQEYTGVKMEVVEWCMVSLQSMTWKCLCARIVQHVIWLSKTQQLLEIDGVAIIGTKIKAPFGLVSEVYMLPMDNVLATNILSVQEAKPKVCASMIKQGLAFAYAKPENLVISCSADELLAKMETWMVETRNLFKATLAWLNKWACARTYDLGSKLPWDPQFMVESLSDSTIYMAYYTVTHLLHGKDLV
ncbi:uncharacterized protein EDB91DRAFT_1084576 [Suillus paluster]|uniref:uncharacterized protein n=1 Tax=Suillus paluster TaxID=48578 RepID=UPI001B87F155|nr:uncharacterized protein EDB91DRAFT_1084576 [Suillus paluster]KAG1733066.1 hypothetical protein EDB91DRAFT_1084576 [Suillus paluster]